jgi:hypothetical protein
MKKTLIIGLWLGAMTAFAEENIGPSNDAFESLAEEQLVTVAYTNMNMDINLSVILNNRSIDKIHIEGKAYNKLFNTSDLKKGIVILDIGGDLVKLQSDNFDPLLGGDINMDYLQDKKTNVWKRAEFSAAFNGGGKVALYQETGASICEIDYLNFEFAKNNLGLPKGVNSIKGTCLASN